MIDQNKDGNITEAEINTADRIAELELKVKKSETQQKMAWIALWSMIIVTLILFTPFIGTDRVTSIGEFIGMFFVAQASIVGAYMGISAWMSKN